MRTDRCRIASLVLLALAAPALAGPLTPPVGVIQSTMKTLAEVEPRTPISDATTPGDGDSRFRITQPGSYYLTSSFTVGGGLAGIEIAAHDVTIDLNGFTITGGAGTRAGVQGGVSQRPTLRNGTIRAMTLVGVDFSGCDSAVIERVTVESCAGGGIVSGNRALISDCIARSNGSRGIAAQAGSRVRDSIAANNDGIGFTVGSGAVAVNCTAYDNNGDGFTTNDGAVIQDCLASSNEDDGFDVTWGITVTGSVAIANAGHGFAFGAHCHIEGNSARGNGSSLAIVGAGFYSESVGTGSTVRGNSARQNEIGFKIDGVNNVLTSNVAGTSSSVNYQIAAGNRVAQIVLMGASAAINGNSGGTALPSADANLAH